MAPKLYMVLASPPVRAVLCAEKALGLNFEHVDVAMDKAEHLSEEYKKMNPQHKVPTFVDEDGSVICDSHAIMIYLVEKYAKDDQLYPKDHVKRSIVNHRLFMEAGHIFPLIVKAATPIRLGKSTTVEPDVLKEIDDLYQLLNQYLEGNNWIAGNDMTLADFSMITSISSLAYLVPIDAKYSNIKEWLQRAEKFPCFEPNKRGLEAIKQVLAAMKKA